ncbi:putative MscS family protein YkuT [Roseibium aggregatum]|uniref:Putative MscS family protein YkuT n=2 Tax=Roseibium aggregatum TaxID=187304 RepID=A0A0M6YB00_9HYPH|nr:putative MscS family protein YkuT [Roseibium aggregatum]
MNEQVEKLLESSEFFRMLLLESGIVANALRIMLIALIAFVASRILIHAIKIACERLQRSKTDPDSEKRVETVRRTTSIIVRIGIWSIAGIITLSILGISIAPLLTAAGVTGIAVGFAAQSLVKDYFSGFVLLLEGQLRVGDIVEIGGQSGVVEEITLRSIRLRDYYGQVIFVPCGAITSVVNKSMGFAQAVVDVGVAYREDTDAALAAMERVALDMSSDPYWSDRIIGAPEIVGVEELADSAVVLRLRLKVMPGAQWEVRRELLRRIKRAFDDEGIEIPFPHLTLYAGEPKGGQAPPLNLTISCKETGETEADITKPFSDRSNRETRS